VPRNPGIDNPSDAFKRAQVKFSEVETARTLRLGPGRVLRVSRCFRSPEVKYGCGQWAVALMEKISMAIFFLKEINGNAK
jgi:hypothetical protein